MLIAFVRRLLVGALPMFATAASAASLDYGKAIHLDAEELAETGIAEAYGKIRGQLQAYVQVPAELSEIIDPDAPRYSVRAAGTDYPVYGPDMPHDEYQSWGIATFVFFKIVNDQLKDTGTQFYALNGGNDLFGIFLTAAEAKAAKRAMPKKPTDWPYLPTADHPWYGQPY